MRKQWILSVITVIAMLPILGLARAHSTPYQETTLQSHGISYGVLIPRLFHDAMGCYTDAVLEGERKWIVQYYGDELASDDVLRNSIETQSFCTDEIKITGDLATQLALSDGYVLNRHIIDTVKQLKGEGDSSGHVQDILEKKQKEVSGEGDLRSTTSLEADLYEHVFLPEFQGYRSFLEVDQSILSQAELDQLLNRKTQGNALDDYVVLPASAGEEVQIARALMEAQRKVIAEYERGAMIHVQLLELGGDFAKIKGILSKIAEGLRTLSETLPVVITRQ